MMAEPQFLLEQAVGATSVSALVGVELLHFTAFFAS